MVRHYVVHSLARGEWRYCCALASVQGRAYTYRYPARNHFLPLFAADFRRNEHQCGLALLAYSFGTDSLCLHDGSTLSSVRGHPDTRSSLSLIFSGHILPVYESWNIYYFKDCSSGTAPALHTFSWVYARLPGELCFAFGATLQAGFVTAVVNLSHRYAKDSAFLCRDFCFAVINRSDRDELRTTIV